MNGLTLSIPHSGKCPLLCHRAKFTHPEITGNLQFKIHSETIKLKWIMHKQKKKERFYNAQILFRKLKVKCHNNTIPISARDPKDTNSVIIE